MNTDRTRVPKRPARQRTHRIEFDDVAMMVLDRDGDGYDCHIVADPHDEPAALRQIDKWAIEYDLDVAVARRALRRYVKQL